MIERIEFARANFIVETFRLKNLGWQKEFVGKLLPPLFSEIGRYDYQEMAFPLCPPLREQQASLDSLSKPNFISKDCTLREGTSEGEECSLHLVRVQINLRVSKYRREFFDAIGGAAFGEFVRKILRVIVGKLHNINEFLADHFDADLISL